MTKQRINQVGSIGAFIGIVFIAYIPQISLPIYKEQARTIPTFISSLCLIWVIYGWSQLQERRELLIIPNSAVSLAD